MLCKAKDYVNLILRSVTPVLDAAHYFLLHPNNYGSLYTFKTTLLTNKSLLIHLWNCSQYFHLNAKALHEIRIVRHSNSFYELNIGPNNYVRIISTLQAGMLCWATDIRQHFWTGQCEHKSSRFLHSANTYTLVHWVKHPWKMYSWSSSLYELHISQNNTQYYIGNNGYRVFLRGKAAEVWCWPPTPF
jgi:hypothetical protein